MKNYMWNPEKVEPSSASVKWPREFVHITRFPELKNQQAMIEAYAMVIAGNRDNKLFAGGCRLESENGKHSIRLTGMELSVFRLLQEQEVDLTCDFEAVSVNPTFRHVMGARSFKGVTFEVEGGDLLVQAEQIEDLPIAVEYQEALDKSLELPVQA